MAGISEEKLSELAEEFAGSDVEILRKLGRALGFKEPKIKQYLATNRVDGEVGSGGTTNMLFDWKRKTPKSKQLSELRDALEKAESAELAEEYCQGENMGNPQGAEAGSRGQTSNSGPVSDEYLNEIVHDIPNAQFSTICFALGWKETRAQNELAKNKEDYTKTYRSALAAWKTRTGGTKDQLKALLKGAGVTLVD